MASSWVKSLQCKSKAFEDVYQPKPRNHLMPSTSCRHSVQNIKDVIDTTAKYKPRKSKTMSPPHKKPTSNPSRPAGTEPGDAPTVRTRMSSSTSTRQSTRTRHDQFLPALTELPEGHPSRNVVEIIFHTSWSHKSFTGRIEMIFKVQNGSKAVARFEEYRELVKCRAGSGSPAGETCKEENARCVADGNEVMGFHCLGPTSGGGAYDACSGAWAFPGGNKGSVICTYSGSGGAHESAGGGRGMRAMLVCRVIAGRVSKSLGIESLLNGRVGLDSVSGESGELLVFDSRAVLPCFLIIYKL
ncbi:uncharacterized protein LOC133778215 [Humulus lupulus]|uniref:uncharacterized protein LOC133778215 n=1 Tax=Humulus lupulus TaxID=3486 RepID=UPI002B4151FE|nr:uncharacterized protein LOC133778215 [Humulus lupulus]